jgi:hypothetical protein
VKKKQKNFVNFDPSRFTTPRSGAEVFWFFFSKKNCFFLNQFFVMLAAMTRGNIQCG